MMHDNFMPRMNGQLVRNKSCSRFELIAKGERELVCLSVFGGTINSKYPQASYKKSYKATFINELYFEIFTVPICFNSGQISQMN